jgi:predicted metal-binding membrane protein
LTHVRAVSSSTPIEILLRRDRGLASGALAVAIVLCWLWLVPMARTMEKEGMMCGVASWAMVDTWEPGHLAMLFAMWAVMMAGMMLPSTAPIVLLYAGVVRKSPGIEHPSAQVYAFAGGYLVVWTLFSAGATVLQRVFTESMLLSPTMASQSPAFAGAMLLLAGVYQMTPWKRACLAWCRAPVDFLTRFWKPGVRGGFRLGVAHGLYCLGCCWALMLLLFVGGVMNLRWIALLTVFVLLEKVTPLGARGARWIGLVPVGIGAWLMWSAV